MSRKPIQCRIVPSDVDPRWAWHYHALIRMRDRLAAAAAEREKDAAEPLRIDRGHPAEEASDETNVDVAFSLLAAENNALAEVDAALQRLHRGIYGVCEATGRHIPAERLRAIPWCRRTVAAEQARP